MGTGYYCDNEIEHVCNLQVADKLARGELPLVEYRVFSDPGGIRTGDGMAYKLPTSVPPVKTAGILS